MEDETDVLRQSHTAMHYAQIAAAFRQDVVTNFVQ